MLKLGLLNQIKKYKIKKPIYTKDYLLIPALIKMIRYLPVDVYINGIKVNVDLGETPLHDSTEHASFIINKNERENIGIVNVYNMGVYAYQIHSKHFSGDVTTSKAIDLNIARNEAKVSCKINKEIVSRLRLLESKL